MSSDICPLPTPLLLADDPTHLVGASSAPPSLPPPNFFPGLFLFRPFFPSVLLFTSLASVKASKVAKKRNSQKTQFKNIFFFFYK